ncbi:MAG: hypothetical protein F9K24_22165 [Leptonema illini]|uniref:Uncharacterized protein n=1 Tax=Leptonema illini TaxID=183 RepID=A0A833GWE1_9LEPT|nr:MAG: hypothetical protein F9K24_22165 [Leptonema illini]
MKKRKMEPVVSWIADGLFSQYDQFRTGAKNLYLHPDPPNASSIAVILENDGRCVSYSAFEQDSKTTVFSRSEVTGAANLKKVMEIMDIVSKYEESKNDALGYDLLIYKEGNRRREFLTCQPGLQDLVADLMKTDGV